jgi:hypothetical protein
MDNKSMEKRALKKIKDEGLVVSNSRLNTWRNCHRMHYFKYVMKLSPKIKGAALIRGSALHECLEYYYSGKSWLKPYKAFKKEFNKNTLAEERALIGDLPQMVYDLMRGYVACYEEEDENLEFLEQELEFTVSLGVPSYGDKIKINGFIDFIAEDDKGIIIGETKTHKRFPEYDVRLFNIQSSIYAWVIREALKKYPNKNVNRIMWNYIKAKQPSKPRLLKPDKNGVQKLSKARLESLPHIVYEAIKEYGLNPKDYQDLISAQCYDDFYRRDILRIDTNVVNSVLEDTRDTARQIYEQPLLKDRNISKNCAWCDYRNLCQAELVNPDSDLDYLIKADFEIRERKDDNSGKDKTKKEKFNKKGTTRNRK